MEKLISFIIKEILKNLTRKYHSDKRNNTMSEDATQREIYARFINELLNIISTYISHVEGKEYDVQVGISIHVEFLKTKTAIDYKISPRK